MTTFVDGFEHRTGEHCASTAIRNMLGHHGLELSEAMVFGLGSGLGFTYVRNDDLSPTRMFHGRTSSFELDFCRNTAIPVGGGEEPSDERAWQSLKDCLDRGIPVMLSTDTYYLAYQNTKSHFPKHRAVVVGYDDQCVWMADRKMVEYQRVTLDELRLARNSDEYPVSCMNEYNHFDGRVSLGGSLSDAIRISIQRNAHSMLSDRGACTPGVSRSIPAMRQAAEDLPNWQSIDDWSWAARFAYQVIVKRGSGGLFFRSLYRDFLAQAEAEVHGSARFRIAEKMGEIAGRWGDLAGVLKDQSERESCSPALFIEAGKQMADLAEREESLFTELADVAAADGTWQKSS